MRILYFTNDYRETLPHVPLGASALALTRARVHSCIVVTRRERAGKFAPTRIREFTFPTISITDLFILSSKRARSLHTINVRIFDVYSREKTREGRLSPGNNIR